MAQVELVQFIPQTGRYLIYYPKNYELHEDEDSIVTISPNDGNSTMTISGYEVEGEADATVIEQFLSGITSSYELTSELKLGEFGEGIKIEATFKKGENKWLWKIFSLGNAMVVVSINSEDVLNSEQLGLYEFMLQNMEVYPD
ncbi:hypothetical protein [Pontibacter roseus]|uniref:hypothetical protein n=1 Tax=Pontibacter roseus TaxID=336989 RepID=UPI000362715F|nr:hypothetical protein [Pontibacter roseus]